MHPWKRRWPSVIPSTTLRGETQLRPRTARRRRPVPPCPPSWCPPHESTRRLDIRMGVIYLIRASIILHFTHTQWAAAHTYPFSTLDSAYQSFDYNISLPTSVLLPLAIPPRNNHIRRPHNPPIPYALPPRRPLSPSIPTPSVLPQNTLIAVCPLHPLLVCSTSLAEAAHREGLLPLMLHVPRRAELRVKSGAPAAAAIRASHGAQRGEAAREEGLQRGEVGGGDADVHFDSAAQRAGQLPLRCLGAHALAAVQTKQEQGTVRGLTAAIYSTSSRAR
jgi:hypothetical protein